MTTQESSTNDQVRVFAGRLVNPGSVQQDVVVTVQDGKITEISRADGEVPGGDDIDARRHRVIPGLIDIHNHGAVGEDFFKDCGAHTRHFLASHGTTAFLATTRPRDRRDKFLEGLTQLRRRIVEQKPREGATILGIHCEGPFMEPSLGCQMPEFCWPINSESINATLDTAGEDLRILALSPELPEAETLIRQAAERGIIVSAAHTRAGTEHMERAFAAGLTHMTHIFNATERPPPKAGGGTLGVGADEFTLTHDTMTAEVIADCQGFHVSPYWLDILFRCKGKSKVALISDSSHLAGRRPGVYPEPGDCQFILREGEDVGWIKSKDKNGLAGSVMTMRDALANLMKHVQMNLEDAIECASLTPATILGIEKDKGSIEPNKDADLVVVDQDLQVVLTMIAGEVVFES